MAMETTVPHIATWSASSRFVQRFPTPFENVLGVEVISVDISDTFRKVNVDRTCNRLGIILYMPNAQRIYSEIDSGEYLTPASIVTRIQTSLNSSNVPVQASLKVRADGVVFRAVSPYSWSMTPDPASMLRLLGLPQEGVRSQEQATLLKVPLSTRLDKSCIGELFIESCCRVMVLSDALEGPSIGGFSSVTLASLDTSRELKKGPDGVFASIFLDPGRYDVTAHLTGGGGSPMAGDIVTMVVTATLHAIEAAWPFDLSGSKRNMVLRCKELEACLHTSCSGSEGIAIIRNEGTRHQALIRLTTSTSFVNVPPRIDRLSFSIERLDREPVDLCGATVTLVLLFRIQRKEHRQAQYGLSNPPLPLRPHYNDSLLDGADSLSDTFKPNFWAV
jgi:hypothetical protein